MLIASSTFFLYLYWRVTNVVEQKRAYKNENVNGNKNKVNLF